MKGQAVLRCFIVVTFVCFAAGASEEEAKRCDTDLKEKMEEMKTWLVEQLKKGPKEGCDRDIINRRLTAFGMAKIECDKAGTNTLFDFPAKEYQAWETMCPRPAHPEATHDEQPPEKDKYSKEKSEQDSKKTDKKEEDEELEEEFDGEEEDDEEPKLMDDEL